MILSSNINKVKGILLTGMLSVVACIMSSCAHEQLCEMQHPHKAWVEFNYDWSKIESYGMSKPDSMFILVDRVINQHCHSLGYDTNEKSGMYISELPDSLTAEDNHDITRFFMPAGEYKFLTVNLSSHNFNYANLSNLNKLSTSLSDIMISYQDHKKGDKLLEEPREGWTDNNQYTRPDSTESAFILTETTPVVIDSTTISKWLADEVKTVNFTPTNITQNIDIFFDIKKDISEVSFEIDSVYAIISGIPHRVNIGNGGLDISNTDKMIFKTRQVDSNVVPTEKSAAVKDSPSNTCVRCFRNVTVLGIVENDKAEKDLYAGPGVMQLIIYNKVYNADGTMTYKKLTGMINIHNSLQNAKLQMFDPELQLYHKTREHSDLYISLGVTIDKAMLLNYEDGGIPKWKEQTIPAEFDIY